MLFLFLHNRTFRKANSEIRKIERRAMKNVRVIVLMKIIKFFTN